MRIAARWIVMTAASAMLLLGGNGVLRAATSPVVGSVVLARDESTGRTAVTLTGTLLTRITGFTLVDASAVAVPGTVDVVLKSKTLLVALLPAGIGGQEYDLTPALKAGTLPVLHLRVEDGVVYGGVLQTGTIPATGSGARMMWYPAKAAFRAGYAYLDAWDDAKVGSYSFATGQNTVASGQDSTALGATTVASGTNSTALGGFTTASGFESTAMGDTSTASGDVGIAMGLNANATGNYSVAMGITTHSQAMGSLALGRFNLEAGSLTNWVDTDPVISVGNGSFNAHADSFTLLKNGNLTISGTLTQNSDARLKKDVAPLAGVLARLAGIRAVTYRMKDTSRGPAGPQIGLLAQEVRETFPELVHEDTQGTLSVAYGNLSAVLLAAVKEQQATIEAREKEIAEVRRELAETKRSLEERLAKIEESMRK